jgi:hypothetical protein
MTLVVVTPSIDPALALARERVHVGWDLHDDKGSL